MKGKIDDKKIKQIKVVIVVTILLLIIWFLIASPLIKFKNMEKQVTEAGKRYFEINNSLLPTGKKIRTVTLQKLYDKDLISDDLRSPYTSKVCDSKESWVKVKKDGNEYKYYTYLKCGILSSKIDHNGPEITLNGEDIITLTKGEKYKDAGVRSVIDDTDGNIDTKKVIIDTSKVNTNKNGTYEVTYKVRDSFNNETIKIRTVKVEQILDKIVEKDTESDKVYKGDNDKNYLKLDGIIFKIVGLNDDGSVKIVSKDALAAVDYNGVNDWLNEYFYNKLSDSAKKYIKSDSKWCNEKVSEPNNYTKCNSYSKKNPVGLLSVADINNSKGGDGSYNIQPPSQSWTSNVSSSDNTMTYQMIDGYSSANNNTNLAIYPAINIKKDSSIVKGNGSYDNPYMLKDNASTLKVGDNVSDAKVGAYISYSGYKWRVIDKGEDGTTKIIMNDVVKVNDKEYSTAYTNKSKIVYSTNSKGNIGYKLNNELPTYIKTTMFDKKKLTIQDYDKSISYNGKISNKIYTARLHLSNMYDLFGASIAYSYWYANYSTSSNTGCIMTYDYKIYCGKYNPDSQSGIRLVGYLNSKVIIKGGKGTIDNPYRITK